MEILFKWRNIYYTGDSILLNTSTFKKWVKKFFSMDKENSEKRQYFFFMKTLNNAWLILGGKHFKRQSYFESEK